VTEYCKPTFTITVKEPPVAYEPQDGDVIEKGRRRIEYRGANRSTASYRRSWMTGEWNHDRWLDISASIITIMVRCDGWRLVYRRPQSAEPSHREPVVGMAYIAKNDSDENWVVCITDDGETKSNHGGVWYPGCSTMKEICDRVRSGELVPVPGYKVEVQS